MFGKIKDKLKNLFNKTEEVIEEDEIIEEEVVEKKPKKESKPKKEPKKEKKKVEKKKEVKKEKKEISEKEEIKKEQKKEEKKKVEKKKEVKKEVIKKEKSTKKKEEPVVDEIVEEEPKEEELAEDDSDEEPKEEKKGFFSRIFKKKEVEEDESQEEDSDEEEIKKEPEQEELIEEEKLEEEPKPKESIFKKAVKSVTKKKVTEEDFDKIWVELEIFLLEINIAFDIVEKIEKNLRGELIDNSFSRFGLNEKIREVMSEEVKKVLEKREANFLEELNKIEKPAKILILGVNGTGKTTSIAKIVQYLKNQNLSVVLAAADTFRAAATEQLEAHANKLDVKIIQHKGGSDPAAVAFDAIEHARAKNLDVVLIDTAGRMPNNSNLILELQKINKVSKSDMVIFVGDSISGNDLIEQIELFNMAIPITGVVLTKVDTDEKPGSVVTTAYSIEQPIYFLGVGQTYDDLIPFNAEEISKKLFQVDEEDETE